jgi:tRNA U34 5-methylaminomethyl-2-thiouridine-forming methyltransferase MnmC
METQIIYTEDGSHSLYNLHWQVTFHSKYGAVQESQTIFIDAGLHYLLAQLPNDYNQPISILEMGLGSGLNAFMSFLVAQQYPHLQFEYTAWEGYPISTAQAAELNYPSVLAAYEHQNYQQAAIHEAVFQQIHSCKADSFIPLSANFQFLKKIDLFEHFDNTDSYNLIYYDAFSPTAQPELWEEAMISKLYNSLHTNGIFCTYCAKGVFKRLLRSLNFEVQPLPGPKGKREMTRAVKK